jgi:tripartite ATP-independent transporter DctP family solute receptor
MRIWTRRIALGVLGGLVALLGLPGASPLSAAPIELKLGHPGSPGSTIDFSGVEFGRRVNAALGSKAKVVVFGNSQLGQDKEMLRKLRLGTAAFSIPSTIMTTEEDRFGLFDLPSLVKDREHMKRIQQGFFWDQIAAKVAPKGLTVVAVWENGYRHITNNVKPINTPADLSGIKLRTPKGKWRIIMFKAYGANPTPMAFSELFTAMQTGTVDGQENPLTNIWAAKFHEVQKYLSISYHVYTPAYLVTGTQSWNSLDAGLRADLQRIARETQAAVYDYGIDQEGQLLDKLKSAGMQVNTVDRKAFVEGSRPVYAQFAQDVAGGKELVDKALALAE